MGSGDVDKRKLTSARNKMNQHRYNRSFFPDDGLEEAPDLSEVLALGGFEPFKIDQIKSLPEVIRPLLSRWESASLSEMEERVRNEVPGYKTHRKNLPANLVDDIFNLYNLSPEHFTFVEGNLSNSWRINLLQNLSHYYMKALTERNTLFSYVVTQELSRMLLEQLNPPTEQDPNDQRTDEEKLSDMTSSGMFSNLRDQALDKAQERIDKLEEARKEGTLPEQGEGQKAGKGGTGASKTGTAIDEATNLLELFELMKSVTISQKILGQFIKQGLSLSTTYFSNQFKEQEVDLFEADEIDDFVGLENLHPLLRKVNLDELITHEKLYKLGFDVYLDRSGSMNRSVRNGTGASMQGVDLVKMTAALLLRRKLARQVFFFDTRISEGTNDPKEVLRMKTGGGTDTDMVIQKIIETGVPSLILTDMCDLITHYTKNAYFVGVLGASMYGGDTGNRFLANGQFSSFDGSKLAIVKP